MGQSAGPGIALGGAIIGGLIGWSFGAPQIGVALGGMAGGLVGSLVAGRGGKPLVSDLALMSSAYGRPIPFFYGTDRFPGMMIWRDDIQTHKTGIGKGFAGGSSAYKYSQSAAIAFCQGQAKLIKIFMDGKLVFDATSTNLFTDSHFNFVGRIYEGVDDQLPDPIMQAWVATHVADPLACPAYRGLAYIVFDTMYLTPFGNRFPQISAIWSTNAVEQTSFKTLQLFADDAGGNQYASPDGSARSGVGTDWVRGQVFALTNHFTDPNQRIRVLDIQSGQQIMSAKIADILAGDVGGLTPDLYFSLGLAVGQGGYLYLFSSVRNVIVTLDPDTLKVVRSVTFTTPAIPPFSIAGLSNAVAFPLTSPTGVIEMILGTTNDIFGGPAVVNPITGQASDLLPLAHRTVFSAYVTQIGHNDTIAGKVDIWIGNWVLFDTTPGHKTNGFHLYRVQVTGSDPSALSVTGQFAEVGNFNAIDFGVATAIGGTVSLVMRYSPSDDSLLLAPSAYGRSGKFSISGGLMPFPDGTSSHWPTDFYAQNDRGYVPMGVPGGDIWQDVDTLSGGTTISPGGSGYSVGIWQMSNSYGNMVVFQNEVTGELTVAYLRRASGQEYPVADIITDLCARAGVTSDMIDVSEVDATVQGYTVADIKAAAASLADLLQTFQIDMFESDYLLKFVPRGQASIATITQDDLGSVNGQDASQFWQEKRAQQQELPLQINLRYSDPGFDFLPAATYAKRIALPVPTMQSKRTQSIDLPIRASGDEARAIAERWLYTLWAERETYDTLTGPKYFWLDPADNVTVSLDNGDSYTVRIESTELTADLALRLSLAAEDATVYTTPGTPGPTFNNQIPQTVTPAPFGVLLQWNGPLVQDQDDTGGISTRIYFAVGAYASGWLTGTVYRSKDGATWEQFATVSQAASWGHAINALGDTLNKFSTDWHNTVTIALQASSHPLTSCTYDEMLSGANAALLGEEIIQYKTVTDNGDSTYTLSGILRGRRGSEGATGSHAAGDTFIVLEVGPVGGAALSLAEIGVGEQWRLVPNGRFLDQAPLQTFTYTGDDLRPYAPVHQQRAPSGSDLVLSWTRRTRLDGLLLDGTDTAPLFEATEAYEAYILASEGALAAFDPTDSGTYVRAFTGLTGATCTYTAAEMVTDGFTPTTDTLYVGVYQRSAAIGRGFLGFKVLPAF